MKPGWIEDLREQYRALNRKPLGEVMEPKEKGVSKAYDKGWNDALAKAAERIRADRQFDLVVNRDPETVANWLLSLARPEDQS